MYGITEMVRRMPICLPGGVPEAGSLMLTLLSAVTLVALFLALFRLMKEAVLPRSLAHGMWERALALLPPPCSSRVRRRVVSSGPGYALAPPGRLLMRCIGSPLPGRAACALCSLPVHALPPAGWPPRERAPG